jgi:hypothetical protein
VRVEKGKVRAPEMGGAWGIAAFALAFTGCVDPVAGALRATTTTKL